MPRREMRIYEQVNYRVTSLLAKEKNSVCRPILSHVLRAGSVQVGQLYSLHDKIFRFLLISSESVGN